MDWEIITQYNAMPIHVRTYQAGENGISCEEISSMLNCSWPEKRQDHDTIYTPVGSCGHSHI